MTEQADREHHNGNESKKEHAHVARGVGRVEDAEEKHEEETQNRGFA